MPPSLVAVGYSSACRASQRAVLFSVRRIADLRAFECSQHLGFPWSCARQPHVQAQGGVGSGGRPNWCGHWPQLNTLVLQPAVRFLCSSNCWDSSLWICNLFLWMARCEPAASACRLLSVHLRCCTPCSRLGARQACMGNQDYSVWFNQRAPACTSLSHPY